MMTKVHAIYSETRTMFRVLRAVAGENRDRMLHALRVFRARRILRDMARVSDSAALEALRDLGRFMEALDA